MSTLKKMPILLLGTERSGTNLLRSMLSSHSEIASAPPSGIVPNLLPYLFNYISADTHELDIFSLVKDGINLIENHPSDWEMQFSEYEVLNRMQNTGYWEFFRVVNEMYAEEKGKLHWLSKEPNICDWAYQFKFNLPDTKFIYLVRDGRDVATSMLKGGLHEKHIYGAAKRWQHDQQCCLILMADPVMSRFIHTVRYEDLLHEPKAVLQHLSQFLGLKFEDQMLDYFKGDQVQNQSNNSKFWQNISKPLIHDNFGKYKKVFSKNQIKIFEAVASDELKAWGYQIDTEIEQLSLWQHYVYSAFNMLLNKTKKRKGNIEAEKRQNWSKIAQSIRTRKISKVNNNSKVKT